jgi:hypothetical protein
LLPGAKPSRPRQLNSGEGKVQDGEVEIEGDGGGNPSAVSDAALIEQFDELKDKSPDP